MPRPRTILALGTFSPDRRKRIETVARETGFEIVIRDTPDGAVKWLGSGTPGAVLFDTAMPKAHSVCLKVRSKKLLSGVPIIGLARSIGDSALSKLFAAGADDVVPITSHEAVRRRLQAVPVDESLQPPPDRGVAVIADTDHDRCAVIGRTMSNAGYEVRYAVERRMLEHYASMPGVRLVVASAELGPAAEMVEASRLGGCEAPWIITDIERDVAAGAEIIREARGAVVLSAFIPPDCLLFVSNDLIGNAGASKRAHVRALHGTTVSFRAAGNADDDLGFTYNVSREGLFVRTLAPPTDTRVWLELRPPGQSRRVRLVGEVKWRRPFNPGKFAITPPGFGVFICDGLGEDLELWARSVDELVATARRRRSVNELLQETLRDSWIEPIPAEAAAPPSLPPLTDLDPLATSAAVASPKPRHAPRPGESRAPSAQRMSAVQSTKPGTSGGDPPARSAKPGRTLLGLMSPERKDVVSPTPSAGPTSTAEPKPASQPRPRLASDAKAAFDPKASAPKQVAFDPKASAPKQVAFDPKASAPKQVAFDPKASAPSPKSAEAVAVAPAFEDKPMITLEDLFPLEGPAASEPPVAPVAAAPARSETTAAAVVAVEPQGRTSNKRVLALVAAFGAVVIGGATAIMALSSSPKPAPVSDLRPTATAAAPSATAAPSQTATAVNTAPSAVAASASASAVPVVSASAAPEPIASAPPAVASAPPEVPDDGRDGSELLTMEGYLIVSSSASLDVYSTGVKVGKTNEKNKSRCGMKFVRIGEGDPPKWKSPGATVTIACRSVTRVSIEPR